MSSAPDLAAIPDFPTGLPRWLAWRNESRGGKQTKVPKTARYGRDKYPPDTWGPFDAIADVIRRQPRLFDGPGIVLRNTAYRDGRSAADFGGLRAMRVPVDRDR